MVLYLFNQFDAVGSGHHQVGDHQINPPRRKQLERIFSAVAGQHAIATGLEHDFANGKRLFIIVYAEDGPFRLHFRVV